jgi:murein DD-endopeptidase MepM/ murein hydrolase activator NlpD
VFAFAFTMFAFFSCVAAPKNSPPASAAQIPVQFGTYAWPVVGPVIRGFEAPSSPYTAGHRGVDIASPFGSPVLAAASGVVSFAGKVAGALFVSIDHPDGIRTTYSWLSSISVKKGQTVRRNAIIAASGTGHPGSSETHLHFGAKLNGDYLDPLLLLQPLNVSQFIRLARA